MDSGGRFVHRDIEDEILTKERKHRRPDGHAIYCFPYTKEMVDFDNWDLMFQRKAYLQGGLTMHPFEAPPRMILDLGCGGALWTIEAAKQWKDSKFVGFDFLDHLLPKKGLPDEVAQRIQWVQGNFLEPLPFPPDYFDFIRCVRLTYHLPEDEGLDITREVHRVLKPDGIIEAIGEDLIFPHARIPSKQTSQAVDNESLVFPSAKSPTSSFENPAKRLSGSSDSCSSKSSGTLSPSHEKPTAAETESRHPTSKVGFVPPILPKVTENMNPVNPRDHSQLQMAWEAMLHKNFLIPRFTSVGQLYFGSFFAVQLYPRLDIPLPPNSSTRHHHVDGALSKIPDQADNHVPVSESLWAAIHLARAVRTVIGCKANMWKAYEQLFGEQFSTSPKIIEFPNHKSIKNVDPSADVRDAFETAWSNWESDMYDRIGFRGKIDAELMWTEPSGDTPGWQVWRNSLRTDDGDQDAPSEVDLCRSIRASVGRKIVSS